MNKLPLERPIYTLTVGEFLDLQKSSFNDFFSNKITESTESKDLLTIGEACDYLGMKKATLYSMNCRRQIPFTKVLGKVYYRKSALDQWLSSGERKTQAQLNREIWEGR